MVGNRAVAQVDISLTGEADWHPAQLDRSSGHCRWQDWSFVWDSNAVVRHTHSAPGRPMPRERSARRPTVEPAGLRRPSSLR